MKTESMASEQDYGSDEQNVIRKLIYKSYKFEKYGFLWKYN